MMYRQGDVLLVRVDRTPKMTAVPRNGSRIVLAYGEATGHAHAITDEQVTLYDAPKGERYLRIVQKPALLLHEEHREITLPPGLYRVRRQREYSLTDIRQVVD